MLKASLNSPVHGWSAGNHLNTAPQFLVQTANRIYVALLGTHICLLTPLAFKHQTKFILSGFNLTFVVTLRAKDTELLSLPF